MNGVVEADVCVVGAGFAGLAAARALRAHDRSVVVLEARERVGGRIWTEQVDGVAIDRGGAWMSPLHGAALTLAGELGFRRTRPGREARTCSSATDGRVATRD